MRWSIDILIVIVICIGLAEVVYGQISPGDLTNAHSHLEGISNCTQCHTLGDKVSNSKCLDCHKFLKRRMDAELGYHSSPQIKGQDCFKCHSEHHGRTFEMIRFDQDNFNHALTGYKLEGAHVKVDCRSCHQPDNIIDYEIREIANTYLGLTSECLLCHDDYHQNTLSAKCTNCHTYDAFSPASKFDHDTDTRFKIVGKHINLECAQCHHQNDGMDTTSGIFEGVAFEDCNSCHEDVHQSRFGNKCKVCHNEFGFEVFTGGDGFNHGITDFPLLGAHARVDCRSCHEIEGDFQSVFRDYKLQNVSDCKTCHTDVHEGKFGATCVDCHNLNSWKIGESVEGFNHDMTDFHLKGQHQFVDCRACHIEDLTSPLEFERCMDCHADYHDGRLVSNVEVVDCKKCHSVEGFEKHTYTIEDHATSSFPLTGAHLATPCFACHQSDGLFWEFDALGQDCIDCHDNIHLGFLKEPYLIGDQCTSCHTTESWKEIDFDHSTTDFALEGRHLQVQCSECHMVEGDVNNQLFEGLAKECYLCHQDVHQGQFQVEGVTQCFRCHSLEQWRPSIFNHDSTRFPLQGAHLKVNCQECHQPQVVKGILYIDYTIEKFECVDCHL